MPAPLTARDFAAAFDVSRETSARLAAYLDLLNRWQARINLVGAATLADPWRRHILDSAQLLPLAPPNARTWVDLGSGAGLPGLVLAILGAAHMHLIESDGRKAAFLLEAARQLDLSGQVTVHACRAEAAPPIQADVVTARALAPLDRLLPMVARFAGPDTVALLPKGRQAEKELTALAECPTLCLERLPSRSDPSAMIVRLKGFASA